MKSARYHARKGKAITKLKKKQIKEYNGIEFDSNEEISVYKWLIEAINAGLVEEFYYQPRTFELCEAVPMIRKKYKFLKRYPFITLTSREVNKVGRYVYTPDYVIQFAPEMLHYYPDVFLIDGDNPLYIDVKGDFNSGKNNTSGITFGIKSAWVFNTQGVFIQKVKPKDLFKKTWVPEECKLTPVRKQPIKEFTKECYKSYEEAVAYRELVDELLTKRDNQNE